MPKLIVFRGIPGSGKTTAAREMLRMYVSEGKIACLYESDMYFMTDTGEYRFDGHLLPTAHAWCRNMVREALGNCDVVLVANTNLSVSEMQAWKDVADEYGAELVVYHMLNDFGSVHGVPPGTIAKMKSREADWPGELAIKY
jgi:predicted kinase